MQQPIRSKESHQPLLPHLQKSCTSRSVQNCSLLGSVEVIGVGDVISAGEDRASGILSRASVTSMGYEPVAYYPGPGWVARTAAGEELKLKYMEDGRFLACDQESGANIFISGVKFELVESS